MSLETILVIFIGGGGIGAILSAFFNRKESKDKKEINLLDRAYTEISRLDTQIESLEALLVKQKKENRQMEEKVWELRNKRDELRRIVAEMERERRD